MLGHFFDANGRVLETTLTSRTLAVDLDGPASSRIVAIAGGKGKIEAIRAVLLSGRLSGLITDEPTATALWRRRGRCGMRMRQSTARPSRKTVAGADA